MAPRRQREVIFPAIGFAAWLFYILACGTAFSPDGTQILFTALDPVSGADTVVVCDRVAGDCRILLTAQGGGPMRAVWTPDGRDVITINSTGNVLAIPLGRDGPFRAFHVEDVKDADDLSIGISFPPAIVGSKVFLAGDDKIIRLDFRTGETAQVESDDTYLTVAQGRILYSRELDIGVVDSATGVQLPSRTEFGSLDPDTLALIPDFEITSPDLSGGFAVSPDGSRLAILGGTEKEPQLFIVQGGTVRPAIPLENGVEVAVPRWTPDGTRIYVPFMRTTDRECVVGILEVTVASGTVRAISIYVVKLLDPNADVVWPELDISPDGAVLALAPQNAQVVDSDFRPSGDFLGVYLVDINSAQRTVTTLRVGTPAGTPR